MAFIRSEVNGRQSRHVVLFAFFCTDAIGAVLWAAWCEEWWGAPWGTPAMLAEMAEDHAQACGSLGMNHFVLPLLGMPVEGAMLFLAGRNPWILWSDGLLLPLWLIRLGLLDVLVWNVSPQMLLGDALWFSVMAVMCRVHSLALVILSVWQVTSLLFVLSWRGALRPDAPDGFDHVRYGIYSVMMLVIMTGTYILDEQSRVQSFQQLMSLQDRNAVLAEQLLRWKVFHSDPEPSAPRPPVAEGGGGVWPGGARAPIGLSSPGAAAPPGAAAGAQSSSAAEPPATRSPLGPLPVKPHPNTSGWRHVVMEEVDSSRSSSGLAAPSVDFDGHLPLPASCSGSSERGVRFRLPPTATKGGRPLVPTQRPRGAPRQTGRRVQAPAAPMLNLADVLE